MQTKIKTIIYKTEENAKKKKKTIFPKKKIEESNELKLCGLYTETNPLQHYGTV